MTSLDWSKTKKMRKPQIAGDGETWYYNLPNYFLDQVIAAIV